MNKSQQKPELDDILYRSIQKVATGPGYSKSLSQEDARDSLLSILNGSADPVRAGVFLIALRMKRESMDENKGFLEALIQTTNRVTANIDSVIDISEPYNGYVRGLSVTAFLAPLLAEMNEPSYSHGVESVGPKFGLTHNKVLKTIGSGFDSAAIIRGVEGGITPSLQQQGKYFGYHNYGEEKLIELEPKSIGIDVKKRAIPLPTDLAKPSKKDRGVINADAASVAAAEQGLAALHGQEGMAYDSLLYNASIILLHKQRYTSLVEAAKSVSQVLKSGAVIERLKNTGANI